MESFPSSRPDPRTVATNKQPVAPDTDATPVMTVITPQDLAFVDRFLRTSLPTYTGSAWRAARVPLAHAAALLGTVVILSGVPLSYLGLPVAAAPVLTVILVALALACVAGVVTVMRADRRGRASRLTALLTSVDLVRYQSPANPAVMVFEAMSQRAGQTASGAIQQETIPTDVASALWEFLRTGVDPRGVVPPLTAEQRLHAQALITRLENDRDLAGGDLETRKTTAP
jgi:hypothetical protein